MPGFIPVRPAAQAGDAGVHPGEAGPVARDAGRDAFRAVAGCHQGLSTRQHGCIDRGLLAGGKGRTLPGEVFRHFAQVRVGQVRHQVVHRRVLARAVAEGDQLVVKVTGGLAGDARKVAVAGALAPLPVTGDAALDTRLHGVDLLERRHGVVLRERDERHEDRGRGDDEPSAAPTKC
jgi:hypothetical protein